MCVGWAGMFMFQQLSGDSGGPYCLRRRSLGAVLNESAPSIPHRSLFYHAHKMEAESVAPDSSLATFVPRADASPCRSDKLASFAFPPGKKRQIENRVYTCYALAPPPTEGLLSKNVVKSLSTAS